VAEHRAVVPAGPCLEMAVHPEAARGMPAAGIDQAAAGIRAVADPTAWEAAEVAAGRCEGRSWPHQRDTDPLARQEPEDTAGSLEARAVALTMLRAASEWMHALLGREPPSQRQGSRRCNPPFHSRESQLVHDGTRSRSLVSEVRMGRKIRYASLFMARSFISAAGGPLRSGRCV